MTHRRASLLVWMLLAPLASSAQEAAVWEQPASVSAKDVLPAALVKSEHHSVDETVQGDGFQYRYTVRSE